MDGSHFDSLVKTLATTPLSRTHLLRGLAASAAALAGVTRIAEPGTAKKNHERERKVCVCGADGSVASCHTKKVKVDKVKKLLRHNPCATKGKCQGRNPCATQTPGTQTLSGCTPNCDRKVCGPDGCGGTCGSCGADLVCANGQCASSCPGGQKVCNGECIPNNQCCTNSDCPTSSPTCCGGGCVDLANDARNCGSCGAGCVFGEQCIGGGCRCLANGPASAPCPPGGTCCTTACFCTVDPRYLNPLTCQDVFSCPAGSTECIATTDRCGGFARSCCPSGTTCDEGACRYA